MKFGLMYSFIVPPQAEMSHLDTFRELDRLLPLAEEFGYEAFHTTEHHFQFNGWAPSPLVVLAKAAGLTQQMRLVTNILVMPLYEPLRLVEDILTLDSLCDGRLTLGVSPGYVSEEFHAFRVPYAERFRRFEELLDLLEAAWSKDPFSFAGRYYQVPETHLVPRPVQPVLPIWYGVSGPKLLERAARRRCPVVASPRHTVDELREHYARYEAVAHAVGYEPSERPVIREVFIAPTTARAEALAGPAVTHLFGLYGRKSAAGERELRNDRGDLIRDEADVDFRSFASRYIIGDPETARRQLEELRDALQPTELVCRMQLPGIPTRDFETSLRLFAEEVMPAFAT